MHCVGTIQCVLLCVDVQVGILIESLQACMFLDCRKLSLMKQLREFNNMQFTLHTMYAVISFLTLNIVIITYCLLTRNEDGLS